MKTEIAEGLYIAKPTCCGLTTSKNGHDQFAIEVAIEIPDPSGDQAETIHMTKFGGLDDKGLEYTVRDAETVGCDTSQDIREWMIDPERKVRVKVVVDEYGPKLKSIFSLDGGSGMLIRKQAMDETKKAIVAESANARIAALRAKSGFTASASKKAQAPILRDDGDDDSIPF